MKEIIRKILVGNSLIREYATIKITDDPDIGETVCLRFGKLNIDVSRNHWLLCLEPVVFGIWLGKETNKTTLVPGLEASLYFRSKDKKGNQKITARAELEKMDTIEENDGSLLLFRLKKSSLQRAAFFKTWLIYARYYKKPGFSFKKLKAFATAYSYPRRVRVISFTESGYYNIFPMDLLGDITQAGRFVFGLRHTNIALSKIIAAGKLVVSEFSSEHKNLIYELGKHHSVTPPPVESLPFGVLKTAHFEFNIPDWVDSYSEIRITKTINLGSHMLMWGQPEHRQVLKNSSDHLYHIHFLLHLFQQHNGTGYSLV